MKYKSKKPKPETGMEMTVTFCMPTGLDDQSYKNALIQFFESITQTSSLVGSSWLHINCKNIPEDLEKALQKAFDSMNKQPKLTLVVDNKTSIP